MTNEEVHELLKDAQKFWSKKASDEEEVDF